MDLRDRQRGSATLELTVIAPALLILLGLVIVAARVEAAAAAVEQASSAGARAASLSRTASAARAAAETVVRRNLAAAGVDCQDFGMTIDTAGFRAGVGDHASVRLAVRCRVPLSDQGVPGLPGSRVIEAESVSVLDTYRGRR